MVFYCQDCPIVRIILIVRLRWNLMESHRILLKTHLVTIKVGFLLESAS